MEKETFDCVVVGAGIEGSATAYNLAKLGKKTLLLEQFPLLHNRGSSHGATRTAGMGEKYPDFMPAVMKLWKELEEECGSTLFRKTGFMMVGTEVDGKVQEYLNDLKDHGLEHQYLSHTDLAAKFPKLKFTKEWFGVLDPNGGSLYNGKCLQAFQNLFVRYGGKIHDLEQVVDVTEAGEHNIVRTTKHAYHTQRVVLCVGAWTNKFLTILDGPTLPLNVQMIPATYWKADNHYSANAGFPAFLIMEDSKSQLFMFGMAIDEYPGLMKCVSGGVPADPEHRDMDQNLGNTIRKMQHFLEEHFGDVDNTQPAIVEKCICTFTPDMEFILDKLPTNQNIIIGAGFSGFGFKMSPLVGKILAALATDSETGYDLAPYRIERFSNPTECKAKIWNAALKQPSAD